MTTPEAQMTGRPASNTSYMPPTSVVDALSRMTEEELIDLKLRLQKQVDRMQFEIEQFDQALALKAAISDV